MPEILYIPMPVVAFRYYPSLDIMCGIFGIHGVQTPVADRARFIACSKKLRHRGPDWSGCFVGKEGVLVHERLAIVGVGASASYRAVLYSNRSLDTGAQPLVSQDGKLILAVNGEIYNFLALRAQVPNYKFKTHSDCEVILPLVRIFTQRFDAH